MKLETITLNAQRNVTLTAYRLDVGGEFGNIPRRPAVLVLPGGGYSMCSDREADPVALAYGNTPPEQVEQLDAALRQIPNP